MKTLLKRIPTNTAGVFYKEIISKNNKVIDKVFLIRYTDANNKLICQQKTGHKINCLTNHFFLKHNFFKFTR